MDIGRLRKTVIKYAAYQSIEEFEYTQETQNIKWTVYDTNLGILAATTNIVMARPDIYNDIYYSW